MRVEGKNVIFWKNDRRLDQKYLSKADSKPQGEEKTDSGVHNIETFFSKNI